MSSLAGSVRDRSTRAKASNMHARARGTRAALTWFRKETVMFETIATEALVTATGGIGQSWDEALKSLEAARKAPIGGPTIFNPPPPAWLFDHSPPRQPPLIK
jgi:hypothetical protein